MPSSFVQHHIRPLSSPSSRSIPLSSQGTASIQSLFISLQDPSSQTLTSLTNAASVLRKHTEERVALTAQQSHSEDAVLQTAILSRIVVGAYGHALDLHLSEASKLEEEAEWWSDVERSFQRSAYHFLQTLPGRITRLIRDCTEQLRANNRPIHLSSYSPNALRHLFASTGAQFSSFVLNSTFPHTRNNRFSSRILLFPSPSPTESWSHRLTTLAQQAYSALLFPILLAQQECSVKRSELEQLRDQRAEVLGALIQLRQPLHDTLDQSAGPDNLIGFMGILDKVTNLDTKQRSPPSTSDSAAVRLDDFLQRTYPAHRETHEITLQERQLNRPTYLVRAWPRLLFLPPAILYAFSTLYSSRASILNAAQDTGATVQAFFQSWVLEPLKEIVQTVRADRTQGVLIKKQGIEADLASLERMIISLAKDTLKWGPAQLEGLSKQVRAGDLTPVLEVYEDDIKAPIRSVITGNLLRSAFIQVQKAKVDIDQALAGIDKLLKSQELTFAFVGVAPALGVVYILGGYLRTLMFSRTNRSKYGTQSQRSVAWSAVRRVERLLLTRPLLEGEAQARMNVQQLLTSANADTDIPPLTSGLLMLSVSRLRSYGEKCLPLGSRVRDGFIEDVGDLEDPRLDKTDKLRVVERIWRAWGDLLGCKDLIRS